MPGSVINKAFGVRITVIHLETLPFHALHGFLQFSRICRDEYA